VRQRLGKRLGSGFLVRGGDFGLLPADELLLLTNFHVVNAHGAAPGIRPEEAEVVFEADDPGKAYAVKSLVWTSPVDQHDASLLRLQSLPVGIPALPVSSLLPDLPGPEVKKRPRVYIIGYPGGRELSFSFQDNELLDHEGPPAGQPQIPGVVRVHYHAPTEGGNSGSPVFDDSGWKVIALHHKGGRFGMPRLNGQSGTYAANEGLALATLVAAVKATAL
jgi:V8-like Glu-specific endopeptidase